MTDRLILGTAGHIDHGKTTLVRALTGVDCDRLPEEKERGITIELGFAALELPSGLRLGIVDVPGHERLVRTMVSGATGIDLVLFVVAADEGIMPQSREHLAVCELLGVDRGVVALTKIDACDAELVELARLEVEEAIERSSLAGSPVVPVSAVSGEGIPELISALEQVATSAPPRTLRDGPAWLPVDRIFTMRGFGTVVTGTLRGAPLEEGAPVEVFPDSSASGRRPFETRIRGLQTHGATVKRVDPGSRCAVNLHGVDVNAAPRGSVVATPGRVGYRSKVDVELRLLEGAPPLRDGITLTAHIGTAERLARVRPFEGRRLDPGCSALAELRFTDPVVVVEGDRFVVRGFRRIADGGWTLGGGRVIDAEPSRARRPLARRLEELRILAGDDHAAALAVRLRRAGPRGVREEELLRAVRSIEGTAGVHVGTGPTSLWLDPEAFEGVVGGVTKGVESHHRERPLDAWVGLAPVEARVGQAVPTEAIRAALEKAAERGDLESAASGYRRPGHRPKLEDPGRARRLLDRINAAGLGPPTLDAIARETEEDPKDVRSILEHLVREGEVVRVSSDLFFARPAIDDLRARVVAYLKDHGTIDPAAYKGLTAQTRKHTVPLMEYFDTEKLTVRRGNVRALRGSG
jgi:selenocysteine-specific elongation factor